MNPYLLLLIGFLSGAGCTACFMTLWHERMMKKQDNGAFCADEG